MTQSTNSAPKATSEQPGNRPPWLLVLIFRLLLLAVGGGVALILGIVCANFFPNLNPEKPLLLKMLDRLDKSASIPSDTSMPMAVSAPTTPTRQLTPVQRQQLTAQLTQLQTQMKTINDSVTTLETQLGTNRTDEPLEARMQSISFQLQGLSPSGANATSVGTNSTNQAAAIADSDFLFSADKLKVTLPSDVLFEGNNSILRPEAGLLLDKIVTDLRDYPSSTIGIAAHTDTTGELEDNRVLSFRRAKAVEQYLSRALGTEYRWLVVGYGETRPLVSNDTVANQQRNRRVEIAVN